MRINPKRVHEDNVDINEVDNPECVFTINAAAQHCPPTPNFGQRWQRIAIFSLASMALVVAAVLAPVPAVADTSAPPDSTLQQTVTDAEEIAPSTPALVRAGHIDIGPKFVAGKWKLLARDDSAGTAVWRQLEDLVLGLDKSATLSLPSSGEYDFVGAKSGQKVWVVPQSEITAVPWLGWNTQSPAVTQQVQGGVTLTFEGHQGPGQFTLFLQAGNFGKPQKLWTSADKSAQKIFVDLNTHTHANWVFSAPGVHLVRISASAKLKSGQQVSDTQVLRFAVGGADTVAQARATTWAGSSGKDIKTGDQKHPSDSSAAANTAADSTKLLRLVAITLGVIALVGVVMALALVRASRRVRAAALMQVSGAGSDQIDIPDVESARPKSLSTEFTPDKPTTNSADNTGSNSETISTPVSAHIATSSLPKETP